VVHHAWVRKISEVDFVQSVIKGFDPMVFEGIGKRLFILMEEKFEISIKLVEKVDARSS
jgi:hypothetical protein